VNPQPRDFVNARSYRYPAHALRAGYALGGSGAIGAAALLTLAQPAPIVQWVLGAGGLLFLVYFARIVVRQLSRIELDAAGISTRGPLGTTIRWDVVRAVRLNYYSTRQDRSGGWMEFVVRGPRRSIRIESALEGFAEVVGDVVREVRRHGLDLDERTRANLHALGITA